MSSVLKTIVSYFFVLFWLFWVGKEIWSLFLYHDFWKWKSKYPTHLENFYVSKPLNLETLRLHTVELTPNLFQEKTAIICLYIPTDLTNSLLLG